MEPHANGLRRADRLMGSGGLVLLAVLFLLKWYEADVRLGSRTGLKILGGSYSGWHAFTHSRWLWLVTALVAVGAVLLALSGRRLDLGVRMGTVVLALGGLSVVTIVYRIIHHPLSPAEAPAHVRVSYSYGLEPGIWIGLLAALAIVCGGYLAMRDEAAKVAAGAEASEPERGRGPAAPGAGGESAPSAFSGLVVEDAPASLDDPAGPDAPSVATPAQPSSKPPGQAPAGSQEG